MISIDSAILTIKKHSKPLQKETIKPVEKSNGYVISQNIYSPINMPPFRQSAMDGYALHLHDLSEYKLIGEVKAGDHKTYQLKKGEAVRIFTGAPVPDTANAVVMQEKVQVKGHIIETGNKILKGSNIRPKGEQIKTGAIALKKGTSLTSAGIGFLTSLGIKEVPVFKKPTIAIITTGNELIEPGEKLKPGKIYESNSKMLLSALYSLKFYDITLHKVEDHYETTYESLNRVIPTNDLVIITGGISVGDYDFVGKVLEDLKVKRLFYKVNQKPGKPLYYGKMNNTSVFALPGNPAAALTCFYMYVYITLNRMMDHAIVELPRIWAKSLTKFEKRADRPQFLKAILNHGKVEILDGQNSSMLQSYAISNALVFMPEKLSVINIGDQVETIVLPV
ncbi:gephyrin-like molybdotransferase Glp [Aestuariivivens sediminis]|uniref:molybdopterin molybdotransferase MoeA n=1 Tax=Aestuariivivens sediminis TaxID=2913557 RepID=UPI001F586FFD|nr:gephyrin-like molybdotransferase Glp [Aestuariivivens sediminis]